jgi:hypothetical protein
MISETMFAAVIDGAATNEERRLVYKAIESDKELRQMFEHCMYTKIFENEIENDFRTRHADITFELEPEVKILNNTVFNIIHLSTGNSTNDTDYEKTEQKETKPDLSPYTDFN